MKQQAIKNFPWILHLKVEVRKDWFSKLWKTRGANYLELQVWIFKITIGMPWIKDVLADYLANYKSLDIPKATNNSFLAHSPSIQIGNYK